LEGDVEERPPSDSEPKSYTEVFRVHFPYYLAIGMTYDEYWNQDCLMVKDYREAQKIKLKIMNHEAWWQGLYFYEALCYAAPLLQTMTKGPKKPLPYPEEPHPITKEEVEAQQLKRQQEKFEQMMNKMKEWQKRVNITQVEKKGAGDDGSSS
jgi:hypothetical protein